MKVVYVHHGNRKVGALPSQDDDLTPIGYRDCEIVAEMLKNEEVMPKLKAIYTSPYFRCKKTAEILNKNLCLPIFEDKRLDEFGSVVGESWIDLQNRVGDCIDDILEKFDNDDMVICVTSGVNISAFINKAYKLKSSNEAPFLGVPSCSPIIFDFKKIN